MDLKPRTSLLAQHKKILGFDPQPMTALDRAEADRIERLPLPPLDLSRGARRSHARGWFNRPLMVLPVVSVVFTAILVMIFVGPQSNQDDTLRSKGESKVWLYFERGGVAGRVSPDTVLQNGDRIRVEVLAADTGIAYLAIMNRDEVLLSSSEQILRRAMPIEAGETKAFEGSIELVGANEGETAVVMICSEPLDHALLREHVARKSEPLVRNKLPKSCAVETIKLR